jgi:hypothetical protein
VQCRVSRIEHRDIYEGFLVDVATLDPRITEPFKDFGWDALLAPKGPIHKELIKQFYASFTFTPFSPDLQVHFQLNKTKYSFSTKEFGALLGLPSNGDKYYHVGPKLAHLPKSINLSKAWECLVSTICGDFNPKFSKPTLSTMDLKIPFLMQYMIIRGNLFANANYDDTIQAAEFAFLWHLQTRVPCDLTSFVIHRMKGAFDNENRELPYGLLLNSLFYGLKIPILGPSYAPTYRPIDHLTVEYEFDKAMKRYDNTRTARLLGYESDAESSTKDSCGCVVCSGKTFA